MFKSKSYFSSFIHYGIGIFVTKFIGFLLIPFYISFVSKEAFGFLDIFNQILNISILILGLEITQGLSRFYYETSEDSRWKNISTAFWFSLIIYFLLAICFLLFSRQLSNIIFNSGTYILETQLLGITIFFAYFNSFFCGLLVTQQRAKEHSLVASTYSLVTSIVTLIAIRYFEMGFTGLVIGLFLGYFVSSVISFWLNFQEIRIYFNTAMFREMLQFSLPLVISSGSIFLLTYFDRLIILKNLDYSELGIYSLGYKIALIGGIIFIIFKRTTAPYIYENYKSESFKGQLSVLLQYYLWIVFSGALFFHLFSEELILLISDNRFLRASDFILLMFLSNALFSAMIFFPGLSLFKKTKRISTNVVAAALLNIGLNLILIPPMGLYGAAWATMTSNAVLIALHIYHSHKLYPIVLKLNWISIGLVILLFFPLDQFLIPKLENMPFSVIAKSIYFFLYLISFTYLFLGRSQLKKIWFSLLQNS